MKLQTLIYCGRIYINLDLTWYCICETYGILLLYLLIGVAMGLTKADGKHQHPKSSALGGWILVTTYSRKKVV